MPNNAKYFLNKNFFHKLLDFQENEIMIFGDMNGVLDPKKDKSKKTKGGRLPQNWTHPIHGYAVLS